MLQFILFFICLIQLVCADEIYIYGPPQNSVYHPADIVDIRYRVRSMGMTRIWATSATLTNTATNKTVNDFPLIHWNASNATSDNNSTSLSSLHDTWTIPTLLPLGNYTLTISGNTTYLCSKNGNGSAPFTHCNSMLYKSTSFLITNTTTTAD